MQQSYQLPLRIPRDVSKLMDDKVRVCDTCGHVGLDSLLVVCHKCHEGAEHTYCMRVKLKGIPKEPGWTWTCEECMPREETNQLVQDEVEEADSRKKGPLYESSANRESIKGSKLISRSSYIRRNDGSSSSHLPAKRHQIPLEAQSVEKNRAIETVAVSPKSNEPCNNSLLYKDFSCKKVKTAKKRSVNQIVYSVPQRSSGSQEKEKVPHASDVIEPMTTLTVLNEKEMALTGSVISPRTSNPSNHSLLSREPPSKNLGKVNLDNVGSVSALKKSSKGPSDKEKLPHSLDDELPKLDSQTEIAHDKCSQLKLRSSKAASLKSKGQLAKASLQQQKVERNPHFHDDGEGKGPGTMSKTLPSEIIISEKSNATCSEILLIDANKLDNPPTCVLASDSRITAEKGEKETVSDAETLLLGPRFCDTDAVESAGQLDHRLQESNQNTDRDSNCPNEKKKDESQPGEQPTEAATVMSIDKLCTDPTSDERTDLRDLVQVEAALPSEDRVIPQAGHTWLGRFQIQNSEGTTRTLDGIQAHLSTSASLQVLEMVGRLPEIIVLEELPRLKIWPSQFMESQVAEENVALYFFPQDLDSHKYYAEYMDYMMENDLTLKGNLDGVEILIFPSNILPEKSHIWNHMFFFWGIFNAEKVIDSANTPVSNSLHLENKDSEKLWAFDLNADPEDEYDEGVNEIEVPNPDGIGDAELSGDKILVVGESSNCKEGKRKDKSPVMDINLSLWDESATPENGLLGIEDNNVEQPSISLSLAPPTAATHEENMDLEEVQIIDFLELLSRNND